MWLFCCILNNGASLCQCCCHHNIDGCTHRHNIHINMCTYQMLCCCRDHTIGNLYFRPKCAKTLDMLVDRTTSNIAAPRQCHNRPFVLTKQCSEQIIRCPYFTNIFSIYDRRFSSDIFTTDPDCIRIQSCHRSSNACDRL